MRPEGVLDRRRRRQPGYIPVVAHIIEPLGAYDIVDLKVGDQMLRARTHSGFVKRVGDTVWARLDAGADPFLRHRIRRVARTSGLVRRHGADHARRGHQEIRRRRRRLAELDPRRRRRRVLRPARPDRRRQDDDAPADRRARQADRRPRLHRPARTSSTGPPPSATSPWCSSTTRSIRATRSARTSPSR